MIPGLMTSSSAGCCQMYKTLHYYIHTHWSSAVEFGITGYYDLGWLQHAGSQNTDLSRHVPISTFCCTMRSQSSIA